MCKRIKMFISTANNIFDFDIHVKVMQNSKKKTTLTSILNNAWMPTLNSKLVLYENKNVVSFHSKTHALKIYFWKEKGYQSQQNYHQSSLLNTQHTYGIKRKNLTFWPYI